LLILFFRTYFLCAGFTSKRVIKPKTIWDPDVPETAISNAQFAGVKTASQKLSSSEDQAKNRAQMPIINALGKKKKVKEVDVKKNESVNGNNGNVTKTLDRARTAEKVR